MRETLGFFKWSFLATIVGLVAAGFYGGLGAVAVCGILILLEASISFDNATVNANVLRKMGERWQTVFLTIGIVIAVFGMRVLFPILIVAFAINLGVGEVVNQALYAQEEYARNVEMAIPIIASFGGMFLLLVFLEYFLDVDRNLHWLGPIERGLSRLGRVNAAPVTVALIVLLVTSQFVRPEVSPSVLFAGLLGIVTHLIVSGVTQLLDRATRTGGQARTGFAGFASFLYLEMLDASFSFDGVIGAFAITTDIVVIALGLGVGAIYIRSLTVYLVRRGTLFRYEYLTAGAHWAIGVLAVVLLVETAVSVPPWLTAALGIGFIGAAFVSSIIRNRRGEGRTDDEDDGAEEDSAPTEASGSSLPASS
ncbi:MAG: Integral membrane protein [uncultured Solirubrobacterales bacterium]|uniref:Integral membrane protein n=1 Tax=uncultured Solirubrobacterales bacterium TaxID=768556 RepID=A0A6J4RQU8_9ACTN|nr:MAG: Integral membrane protein [uncultured Solirubrobacterales bacterium]